MNAEQIAGLVKPLKWKKRGNSLGDIYCNTEVGQYSIGDIHGQVMVLLRRIEDGQDDDRVIDYADDFKGGKAAAQADYAARTQIALNIGVITALAEDAARAHDLALEVERLREDNRIMAAALDDVETGAKISTNGNVWRFWQREMAKYHERRRAERDTHAATAAVMSARDSIPEGE